MAYLFTKRLLDLVAATFGLIIFSPLLVITAILVKLSSEGPVLVENSSRVGKNNKLFRMYKFRSMIKDAHNALRKNPELKEFYEKYRQNSFKLDEDPRVTKIGSFLRKTSIDELPQFLNVLKGEMSLIGPRAYYPDELEEQRKNFPQCQKFIDQALTAKPGMTGLWQVSGRSEVGFEKRIEMDAIYAQTRSLLQDLIILVKTPLAVFRGERNGHK